MRQVPDALKFAGYSFEKELLNEIFGSKSTKGKRRTVKKLRDSITHKMKEKDIKELIEREDELFGYMDAFLAKIRFGNDIAA